MVNAVNVPASCWEHGRIDGFPFWCEVDFGCAIPVVSHVQGRFSKQRQKNRPIISSLTFVQLAIFVRQA